MNNKNDFDDKINEMSPEQKKEIGNIVQKFIAKENDFQNSKEYKKFKKKKTIFQVIEHTLKGIAILIPFLIILVVFYKGLEMLISLTDFLLGMFFIGKIINDQNVSDIFRLLIGFFLIVLVGYSTYYFTSMYVGKRLFNKMEIIIIKMPIIGNIYNITKDFLNFFNQNKKKSKLGTVVMVEYPLHGVFVLGIVNNFREAIVKDVVSVYIPTAPNPTSGYNVLYYKKDIKIVDISIEDMMKYTIGLGSVDIPSFYKNLKSYDELPTMADYNID